ncbi:MAG: SRPBCC family protein [Acidobacteria bacterium]|nr:SRPBCC family protein [Acidobacteriota bacterium]
MQTVIVETRIAASPQRCFDAARDIDLHVESLAHTGERAIAGKTSGLIGLGEEVTWRGRHFGIVQRFTSKITALDAPYFFQDTMQRGAFRSFVHDHYFLAEGDATLMRDVLAFSAPLGLLGRMVERLALREYLRRLLVGRAEVIRRAVED